MPLYPLSIGLTPACFYLRSGHFFVIFSEAHPVSFSLLLGHGGVEGFCNFKLLLFLLGSQVLWFRGVELFVEELPC